MTARRRVMTAAATLALLVAGACSSDDPAPAATEPAPDSAPAASDDTPAATDAASDPAGARETSELLLSGESLVQLDDSGSDPAIGVAAPVITGQQFDGSEITIGGQSDGPTMLVFLAHWCPHCNDEIPEMNQLRDGGELPADLDVVGVSTAVAPDRENYPPSEWIVEKDWTWPVLADSESADAFIQYGGSGFPFSVILDSDGNVLGRKAGSSSAAQIDAWIDSVLNPTN